MGQLPIRDQHTVYTDALVELHQIGRGIQPNPVAGLLQNRSGHAGGRALAVGARQMDKFQPVLRVAERRTQRTDAVQAGLAGKAPQRVNVFYCCFRHIGIHDNLFFLS